MDTSSWMDIASTNTRNGRSKGVDSSTPPDSVILARQSDVAVVLRRPSKQVLLVAGIVEMIRSTTANGSRAASYGSAVICPV
jgi:hypothetical protein